MCNTSAFTPDTPITHTHTNTHINMFVLCHSLKMDCTNCLLFHPLEIYSCWLCVNNVQLVHDRRLERKYDNLSHSLRV